jgi:hypothetical protein
MAAPGAIGGAACHCNRLHRGVEEDSEEMDRERAETYLRLLAEAELRRAMKLPTGSNPGRWDSATLALAAQTLSAVGTIGADLADEIQADTGLAVVPPGDTPHMSKMIDLTMLGMLTGRERPEEDWRDLLTSAGFTDIGILPTGSPVSVIHATVR